MPQGLILPITLYKVFVQPFISDIRISSVYFREYVLTVLKAENSFNKFNVVLTVEEFKTAFYLDKAT